MSIILVNPVLYNVLEFKSGSHRSYLELVKKHAGSASNWRSIPTSIWGSCRSRRSARRVGIPVHVVNGMLALHTSVLRPSPRSKRSRGGSDPALVCGASMPLTTWTGIPRDEQNALIDMSPRCSVGMLRQFEALPACFFTSSSKSGAIRI